jgi:NadR type nicotinamide-nucleotide adenylyltransferase
MSPIKKTVIIGPESTGKSTLTQALAKEFEEPWVEEYARRYLENLPRQYNFQDLLQMAMKQIALEDEKEKLANQLLFCDTDLHVIMVWSEYKFKKTHPWILGQIKKRTYDLYLLTDIDIPWQEDPLREHPEPKMRKYFFEKYNQILLKTNTPFVRISGDQEERMRQAASAVRELIL